MQPPPSSVQLQFDDLFIKKELIAYKKVSEDCDDAEEDQEKEEEGVLELGTLIVQGRGVATRAVRRVRVDQFTHLFFVSPTRQLNLLRFHMFDSFGEKVLPSVLFRVVSFSLKIEIPVLILFSTGLNFRLTNDCRSLVSDSGLFPNEKLNPETFRGHFLGLFRFSHDSLNF